MKRTFPIAVLGATGALAWLIACEGEPPKTPITPPVPASVVTAEPGETAAPATTCTPPPPPCAVAAPLAAAADAGDDAAPVAVADAAPPAVALAANVRGTVKAVGGMTSFAVVYVDDVPKEATPTPKQIVIDNGKMMFMPFVGVIPAGGRVVFHNSDPFPHNVFSPDHEKFDMGQIPHDGARVRVFDKPGAYTLLCNLHPGMLGYVLVTPSNAFARVDAKGNFVLKDLPNGTYKLSAWAPRNEVSSQSVTIAGGDVNVTFELHK